MRSERDPAAAMTVIYLAMAGGVAILAVAAALLAPGGDPGTWGAFRIAWLAAAGGGLLLGGVLRRRFEAGGRSPEEAVRSGVLVWALAEGPALLGLVSYFLTGDRAVFVLALVVFAWAMVRNPPGAFRPAAR